MSEQFNFRVGDRVRIICQGLDVTGKVHSAYNQLSSTETPTGVTSRLAGVEMHSDSGNPHYWKAEDGGRVYRWVGKWVLTYPHFMGAPDLVHPHFKVFLTDETDFWTTHVISELPEGCKLMGAYLVDVSREVHICSTQPSYEAWWLYTVPTVPVDRDDIIEIIAEADAMDEPMRYFNTHVEWAHDYGQRDDCGWIVEGLGISDSRHEWVNDGDFETYEDLIEHMLEEANANHPV